MTGDFFPKLYAFHDAIDFNPRSKTAQAEVEKGQNLGTWTTRSPELWEVLQAKKCKAEAEAEQGDVLPDPILITPKVIY